MSQKFLEEELQQLYYLADLSIEKNLQSFCKRYQTKYPLSQLNNYNHYINRPFDYNSDDFLTDFKNILILEDSQLWFPCVILQNTNNADKEQSLHFFNKLINNHVDLDCLSLFSKHLNLYLYCHFYTKNPLLISSDVVYQFCEKHLTLTSKAITVKKVLGLLDFIDLENRFIPLLDTLYHTTSYIGLKEKILSIINKAPEELKKYSSIIEKPSHAVFSSEEVLIYQCTFVIDQQILRRQDPSGNAYRNKSILLNGLNDYITKQFNITGEVSQKYGHSKIVFQSENSKNIKDIKKLVELLENNFEIVVDSLIDYNDSLKEENNRFVNHFINRLQLYNKIQYESNEINEKSNIKNSSTKI